MKTVAVIAMTAVMSLASVVSFASPGDADAFRGPRGRSCEVRFKTCSISVGGICLKSKNRSFRVDRRESRFACQRVYRQYNNVRSCSVRCN